MYQLQLTIPEPCHEDWNKMTPNEQGKFCNSCAKTVIDFSTMTDGQVLNYFLQLKGQEVCGKTHPEQLQRTIQSLPAPRKKIFGYWQYAAAFFMMLLKAPQAKAQVGRVVQTNIRLSLSKAPYPSILSAIKITDVSDEPIYGASIRLLSNDKILVSDSAGIVDLYKEDKNETLIISAIGYNERSVAVKDIQFGKVRLEKNIQSLETVVVKADAASRHESVTLGGMGYRVVEISIVKDSVTKLAGFVNPSITAYPNPVAAGNTVNLALKIKKAGLYRFYISDAAGKLLLVQNHTVPDKTFIQQIPIPSTWSSGIYFVKVEGGDGKNIGKVKIVVQ